MYWPYECIVISMSAQSCPDSVSSMIKHSVPIMQKELCFRLHSQSKYHIDNNPFLYLYCKHFIPHFTHGHPVNHDKCKGDKISEIFA